jgi:glycosyltransferase involved in cell wall biosynthesis
VRILSVIETLTHGGAETVLVDLVLGLARHDHRVLHFSTANGEPPHRPFLDALAAAGVPCIDAPWTCVDSPARRDETLGDFAPDIVIFHWWGNDPWLSWVREVASDAARPRFVAVLHCSGLRPPAGYDRYVIVCAHQRPQVAHVPAERVRCIPNGVDLQRFAARGRAPGTPVVVGRLSSLREGKIPRDFVRVAAAWKIPGVRYVIAGAGPLQPALADDARRLGDGDFRLPGYVPRADVPGLLATFDVFCYTTAPDLVECHPLALLEALAAGVPVVAEARGGIPEIVSHGVNGLLGRSADEIGEHLRALVADGARRGALARGARASAPRFSLAAQLTAYDALLESARAGR